MGKWIWKRIAYAGELASQKAFSSWAFVLSVGYSAFTKWRDDFASMAQQDKWRAIKLLPDWPLSWWIAISFGSLALWIFEASFRRQQPGMELIINEAPRSISFDRGPLVYSVAVGLRNGCGRPLTNCRLQLRIVSHDGIKRQHWVRHPICAPFHLSPDDVEYITMFEYEFDTPEAALEIPIFDRQDGQWERREGICILTPGRHDLIVEALSDDSRIARAKIKIDNKDDRWWINGNSTGTR